MSARREVHAAITRVVSDIDPHETAGAGFPKAWALVVSTVHEGDARVILGMSSNATGDTDLEDWEAEGLLRRALALNLFGPRDEDDDA